MPLSNSVLHRYTPPTCTLQVVAYSSPVSRWVGRKVVKQVQFDLRFDDPRSPADKQFSITGDIHQLEYLHTVVTNYIQDLLNLSPESFAALSTENQLSTPIPTPPPVDVESDVWLMPIDEHPPVTANIKQTVPATITQGESFALKPATGLTHNLFLGSLATVETGQFIQLSMLQLFDLATALDDYARDLVALPSFSSNAQNSSAPLVWANIAAALLLGVGIAAIGLQVFNRPNSLQTANNLNNRPITTNPPPIVPSPSPFPTLSPATTILVPSPNSNITVNQNKTATPVPNTATKSPVTSNKANPAPNGLPPQPIVVNPTVGQTTTTTVTIPGTSNRDAPVVIPTSNVQASSTTTTKITTPAPQDNSFPKQENTPTLPKPNPPATRTAFVASPQVVEVSNYFNQRWEPPSNLRSSLEYSIVLDVDGSIQVIEPYGLASRTYLDRTGMPLIGERFVSANQDGKSPRIRLRFNPNGKVQAFLEVQDAR